MDLISVIVPVYNVEPYLRQCIESIQNQTYQNIEIILVDDGSTDNCPRICDEYARTDSRIHVIHKKNGGLSDARNTGITNSNGTWLSFVDSDDYIAPTMLERLYAAVTSNKALMSVCNAWFFNETQYWTPEWFSADDKVHAGIDVLNSVKGSGQIPTSFVIAWNKLYHRSLFQNICYPIGKIHEDEFIAHSLIGQCDKIPCISEKLYYYRQNMQGITKCPFNANRLDIILAMENRFYYYRQHGLTDCLPSILDSIFWFATEKFYLVEQSSDNRRKLNASLKAVRNVMPFYLKRNDISWKQKLVYTSFCISPSIFQHITRLHKNGK